MNTNADNLVSERIERLINRRLDHEITPAENAELDAALAQNPAAREMYDDLRGIDAVAVLTLQSDLRHRPQRHAVRPHRWRSLWIGSVGAVLAAAAVVAFSILPDYWPGPAPTQNNSFVSNPVVRPRPAAPKAGQFVDYRDDLDYLPHARRRDLFRDVVGIHGKDKNDRDVIYIFERDHEARRIIPVTGDF